MSAPGRDGPAPPGTNTPLEALAPTAEGPQGGRGGSGWKVPALMMGLWLGVSAFLFLWFQAEEADSNCTAPQGATVQVEMGPASSSRHPRETPAGTQPLRIAVAPVVSPEASLARYRPLVNYVASAAGRAPELVQRPSYADVNALLREGRCDLAFVCTYAYVRGSDEFGLRALAVPVVRGRTHYHSLLVVRRDIPARDIWDTRGLRFAGADILSFTGWIYPSYLLAQRDEDIEHFYGSASVTGGHDRALEAVASGVADVAAVDDLVYEEVLANDPSIAQRVRVVAKSPPFGMPPVVAGPSVSPETAARVQDVLVHAHETDAGRRVLQASGFDRFAKPNLDDYDAIRSIASQVRGER